MQLFLGSSCVSSFPIRSNNAQELQDIDQPEKTSNSLTYDAKYIMAKQKQTCSSFI